VASAGYVTGLNGEQMTETNGTTQWVHTNVFANGSLIATYLGTNLYFSYEDWLGTKRAEGGELSGGTTCLNTYYSLPFGNDLTTIENGCPDATEHHFTQKERDPETGEANGNDYFGARYYQSIMGRFLSPDWAYVPAAVPFGNVTIPQSLNLYSYVRNNPLRLTDANGHVPCSGSANVTIIVGANGSSTMSQSTDDCPSLNRIQEMEYSQLRQQQLNRFNNPWQGHAFAQQVFQGPGSGSFVGANTVVNYAAAVYASAAATAFFAPEVAAGAGSAASWGANASGLLGPAAGRVFWSAIGPGAAADWAEENGGSTLEMTPLGGAANWVQNLSFMPQNAATGAAWNALSSGFASGAQGGVTYLQGAWQGATWLNTELPILTQNGNPITTVPMQ
jgi:RHS repeat-associated protein